jgi:hypothetical protein
MSGGQGGARPGAGRPRGSRGVKQRAVEKLTLAAAEEGELPLAYMLRCMRDPTLDALVRLDVAKAAAPYVHPRLAAHLVKAETEETEVVIVRFQTVYEDGTTLISAAPPGERPPMKTIEHEA